MDHPIIFSAPMVKALLAGTKVQTRRIITPKNSTFGSASKEFWNHCDLAAAWPDLGLGSGGYLHVPCHVDEDKDGNFTGAKCAPCRDLLNGYGWPGTVHRLYPQWRIDDRLWVREACGRRPASFLGIEATNGVESAYYLTDDEDVLDPIQFNLCPWWKGKTCSPIHMPRWASRLTLAVTDVRVQRLNEISCADAIAEGISPTANSQTVDCDTSDPRDEFAALWDSLHGDGAWEANPWVAAISFEVRHANIDALASAEAA